MSNSLPVIDIQSLFATCNLKAQRETAGAIRAACRETGFFYVAGHGVSEELLARLESESRRFFALPREQKMTIPMAKGGPAWRGYFPLGDELTSNRPDKKEGLYFGTELAADHPRVQAGWPLHGANLWPNAVPGLRPAVLDYMTAVTEVGHKLLEGMALSLELERDYFASHYTADPTILFRIFHYPAAKTHIVPSDAPWGVGEHTDYGLLTLLAQDGHGGLQVKSRQGWIDAPPLPGTLICNIGDMLDLLTVGWYRSTPHRVRNVSGRDRLSFPLFFDPDFEARICALPNRVSDDSGEARWDGADLQGFEGSYGDYLLGKVSKVFPQLKEAVLSD